MRHLLGRLLALLVFLALAFTGLRLYGFYHNEKAEALRQAELAMKEADDEAYLAKTNELRLTCSQQWLKYENEQLQAEIIRLKQGEIAYLRAQQKLIGHKPICDGYAMSISDSFRLTMDQVERTTKSVDLRAKSRELTIYAADRKMQTKRLLHKVWASVTGQTD